MKKITAFFAPFCCLFSICFAQEYRLQGCVADSSGAPISAATVMILQGEEVATGAITAENGFYSIFPIDASVQNMFVAVEYLSAKAKKQIFLKTETIEEVDFLLPYVKEKFIIWNCFPKSTKLNRNEPSGVTFEGAEIRRMAGFGN